MKTAFRLAGIVAAVFYLALGLGNNASAQTDTADSGRVSDRISKTDASPHVKANARIQGRPGDAGIPQQFYSLPLAFEKNDGQADGRAAFLTRASGYSALFSPEEVVFNIPARSGSRSTPAVPTPSSVLHMKFLGSGGSSQIVGEDRQPGRVNYFIGNRRSEWHRDIPLFSRVKYRSVYSGTDIVFHGDPYNLEFDFAVDPHADLNQIHLQFAEARRVQVTEAGELLLATDAGEVRFKKPELYQESQAGRRSIEGGFKVSAEGTVSFWAGPYDAARALTIDPVMTYASYFGGTIAAVALDPAGNVYLAGGAGPSLLLKNPYQSAPGADTAAFVTKLDPTAKNLIFSTYISGSGDDLASALAVDSEGNSYITGNSNSADFPTTPGAFMQQCPGLCHTPFVAKFDPTGSLLYATYTGGSNTASWGIAADSFGSAYITGITGNDLPLVNALQETFGGAFVQKLDPTGLQLLYSTYLGAGGDWGTAIAVDATGSAYVVGRAGAGFPTKNPLQLDTGTFFLTKLSATGASLVYSTLLGAGGQYDKPNALAVDSVGNAYLAASITTLNYPLTLNAFQTSCIGMELPSSANGCSAPQAYVLAMNSAGTGLLYATLLGDGSANGIAVDSSGNAYIAGTAISGYLPLLDNIEGPQPAGSLAGTGGAFVAKLNSSGLASFMTYLAGISSNEYGSGIAVDTNQNIFVAGSSPSQDFPIVNQLQSAGTGFLAKIEPVNAPALSVSAYEPLVTVRNVSTETVNISSISVVSASAGITAQVSGTCGTSISLAPAQQCLISISQPGPYYANITVSSNVAGSPQTYTVKPGTAYPPILLYSPPTLRFPPEYVGTVTTPQTITVTNTRVLPVSIDSAQVTNPDFQLINNCTGSLPAGGFCTLELALLPSQSSSSGTYGDINISYGGSFISGGDLEDILFVGGQGYPSNMFASSPSQDFGTQYLGIQGMPRVVTLSNVTPYVLSLGNISATSPFTTATNCGNSVPAYGNCRVAVLFAPTLSGLVSGNLQVNFSGPGSPANIALVGTGKLFSDLSASPFFIDFGNLQLPQSRSQVVTLTNAGTGPMTISGFTLASSQFSQTNDCPISPNKLARGSSCTATVTFTPTAIGPVSAGLSIAHTGAGNPQVIPLTGAGLANGFFTPDSLAFGLQAVGTSSDGMSIWMNNYTNTALTLQSIGVTGDFQVVQNQCVPGQLGANMACGVEIVFTPVAQGLRSGTLTVGAADGQGPHVAVLTGTGGTAPAVALSTSNLYFASQLVGTSSQPQTVTLSNIGNATLNITTIAAPGGFTESNTCSTTLTSGSNCAISVQFAPTGSGQVSGTLTITDDAGGPQSVSAWGNATDFSIQSVGGITATVSAGQAATYNLQSTPAGGFTGQVSLTCTGAPKEATCGVSPTSIELLNQPGAFVVTVATRAPSRVLGSSNFSPIPLTAACTLTSTVLFLVMVFRVTSLRASRKRLALLTVGVFATLMFLAACGGGGSSSPPPPTDLGTPSGTYPITVTATSGSSSRTIPLSLTVR